MEKKKRIFFLSFTKLALKGNDFFQIFSLFHEHEKYDRVKISSMSQSLARQSYQTWTHTTDLHPLFLKIVIEY